MVAMHYGVRFPYDIFNRHYFRTVPDLNHSSMRLTPWLLSTVCTAVGAYNN